MTNTPGANGSKVTATALLYCHATLITNRALINLVRGDLKASKVRGATEPIGASHIAAGSPPRRCRVS